MTDVAGIVAMLAATINGLSQLAQMLVNVFKVPENEIRAKLAANHQITDTAADDALELIRKTSEEVNG